MKSKNRIFSFGIWGLAIGYFCFYTPYSALIKIITLGLWPGIKQPLSGFELLPLSVIATVAGMLGFITVKGWWKYAGRRQILGLSLPFPNRWTFLSGLCTTTIIGTTTLAFSFSGASIVFVLVLLRGGVLIIGPVVDALLRRKVRWFSWAAMGVSLLSLLVALGDAANYKVRLAAGIDIAAYLTGYFFRLQYMTRLAKSEDSSITLRYFVEEQIVATPALLAVLAIFAVIGRGEMMLGFRHGFTGLFGSGVVVLALLVGLSYAALCVCTTFIFLDRRENTFCIPVHCGSSMLAGVAASYALAFFFHQRSPNAPQLASAGLIIVALLFLSPLHHLRVFPDWLWNVLRIRRALAADQPVVRTQLQRVFLFICSGNTSRSPMAEWICKAEIAARLNIPFEASLSEGDGSRVRVLSAGLTARDGAPMTASAQQALRHLGTHALPHAARNLTPELAHEAEIIYCMTEAQRQAVIANFPFAAEKAKCLDPSGDIADPSGAELDMFIGCAELLRRLIRTHLDAAAVVAEV